MEIVGLRKETAGTQQQYDRTDQTDAQRGANGCVQLKMEAEEGIQTRENGDRQTRRRKTMEPSEVSGEWCPTLITLAGRVTDDFFHSFIHALMVSTVKDTESSASL